MKPPTVAQVVAAAVAVTSVHEDLIRQDYRHPRVVAARRATVIVLYTLSHLSFADIARHLRNNGSHGQMARDYEIGMLDEETLDMAHRIERKIRADARAKPASRRTAQHC